MEKWLKEQGEQLAKLREELKKVKESGDHGLNMKGLTIFPEKSKMPEIYKYDETRCPKTHLQLFFSNVGSMGLTQKQMAQIFPRTLSGAAGRWFTQIEKSTLKSWDDIANAFLKQYNYNTQIEVTRRGLEMTRQRPNETFTDFLARWKAKAAQVIDLPPKKKQVRIMINNMSRQYHNYLYFQGMTTYDSLIEAATRIEDRKADGNNNDGVTLTKYEISLKVHKRANGRQR